MFPRASPHIRQQYPGRDDQVPPPDAPELAALSGRLAAKTLHPAHGARGVHHGRWSLRLPPAAARCSIHPGLRQPPPSPTLTPVLHRARSILLILSIARLRAAVVIFRFSLSCLSSLFFAYPSFPLRAPQLPSRRLLPPKPPPPPPARTLRMLQPVAIQPTDGRAWLAPRRESFMAWGR
ncbi:hypothetical protein CDD80_3857 [Ophiocordyceps camponoti-rufipedis]|uniref:Uncharacterized protein n=1 Tax=Ophiocordyceps camponoti-rufipedis TaxID=2004952 RepID=A0A2C5Z1Z2_9HYPO|nr:hypothetical protein CDD80_3857 [Ophiocordyceps camponoti-rufipedis]